jgi:AraC-like DNA-binding protein/mannose-6-phosphate isomerase-like protein (cupin superfamily)
MWAVKSDLSREGGESKGASIPEPGTVGADQRLSWGLQESAGQKTGFVLLRMEEGPIPPSFGRPHRHDLNEILIIRSGQGRHVIDGYPIDFRSQSVCFVPKDHVHVMELNVRLAGWLIQFSDDFLGDDLAGRNWSYRALADQLSPSRTADLQATDIDRLDAMMAMVQAEYLAFGALNKQSLHHWLSLLIIQIGRSTRRAAEDEGANEHEVHFVQRFVAVLEENFATHHDVGYYAAALNVDQVALSKAVGSALGKTTKRAIEERVILEAKRKLLYSRSSIKAIAFDLGYVDQFNFTRAFRRLVGIPPTAFRDLAKLDSA